MARQFLLAHIAPSPDGKTVRAEVVDRDWSRFTTPPPDVRVLGETPEGNVVVQFPTRKLVGGSILDFDR